MEDEMEAGDYIVFYRDYVMRVCQTQVPGSAFPSAELSKASGYVKTL